MTQRSQTHPYKLRAIVLQNGHVDPITGPRCFAKMAEGPNKGLYFVVHTDAVLTEGTPLIVDTINWTATVRSVGEARCR